jgi:hypothetical protein
MWHAPGLPVMPEQLASGSCTRHPEPDLWTSRALADRARAIAVCSACPVRVTCREWAVSLPPTDTAIYGGLWHTQRLAARRERAQALP